MTQKDDDSNKISYSFKEENKDSSDPQKEYFDLNDKVISNFSDQISEEVISEKNIKKFSGLKIAMFFLLDIFLNLLVIVILVIFIRTYLVAPFKVSGSSMCDTLNIIKDHCQEGNGETILVNKFTYLEIGSYEIGAPKRGDIVVFRPPNETEDFYIKRIIGLPGDKIIIKNGKVYIKELGQSAEKELVEDYLNADNKDRTLLPNLESSNEFLVPADNYFVMGDNRRHSSDSRHCFSQIGCSSGFPNFLERSRIEGKAWFVFWPIWLARFTN